jgi:crotonobetainyl-CoA:carnitine CoA-transferase CaiB-like acyl-CoA transferase
VDLNVFHSSGWGYHTPTGADPAQAPLNGPGRFLPSYEAGLEGALCLAAAFFDQSKTGRGRFIEISQQAVLASRVDYVLGQMIAGDMDVSADRSAFDLLGPAGIFPCRDGHIYIWMSAPNHWQGFCELLGKPAWTADFPENWLERDCTTARVARVREHLLEWLKNENKHEAAAKAQKLGVTLVAVNNASDLMESEQYAYRGFFAELEHPVIGKAHYPTVPYKLSCTPVGPPSAAPLLGQDNDMILAAAGWKL